MRVRVVGQAQPVMVATTAAAAGDSDSFTSRGFHVYVAAEEKFWAKNTQSAGSARAVCRIDHHFVAVFVFFFPFSVEYTSP